MWTIAVVTGGRADYGLLRPLLQALTTAADMQLQLVVTGYHLSPSHGETWRAILEDGFAIAAKVECQLASDSTVGMSKSLGLGVIGCTDALDRLRPDAVVVLGDRYEILAAAQAALLLNIPIVHIHGGELTQGAIDDSIRHAISKMASLHFVATEDYRRRLEQMGETNCRIVHTGALAVDNVVQVRRMSLATLNERFGCALSPGFILVTLHPETASSCSVDALCAALCPALLLHRDRTVLITGSNADAGGLRIDHLLKHFASQHEGMYWRPALGVEGYVSAAALAGAVLGNSSSGLLEVPLLGTPVVNIGDRQKGRFKPACVQTVAVESDQITLALTHALTSAPHEPSRDFGAPGVAQRMLSALQIALAGGLDKLPFVDR